MYNYNPSDLIDTAGFMSPYACYSDFVIGLLVLSRIMYSTHHINELDCMSLITSSVKSFHHNMAELNHVFR